MTTFTKTPVGNKHFTVEWNFSASGSEVEGDKFECANCELVSIFGIAPAGADARIAISNHSDPSNYRTSFVIDEIFYSPTFGSVTGFDLPAPSRWIWPILDVGSGDLKLAMLFREI